MGFIVFEGHNELRLVNRAPGHLGHRVLRHPQGLQDPPQGFKPAAAAFPESLLEIQILAPSPTLGSMSTALC